ncbi:hypothetical protein AB0C65_30230 [Nocardia sp. NPDC048505]|uniref:hypothetical protein n=1 Tax=Nocardia sp. NPDC048505 TaxID=3155756 RepID=UPI0033E12398
MRGWWGASALVAAMALGTGCTNVVAGSPAAEPAALAPVVVTDYGLKLTVREASDVRAAAVLRTLEPCGFVSRAELAAYGRVVQVAPERGPERCKVLLYTDSRRAPSVTLELGASKPVDVADFPVAGGTVLRQPTALESGCALVVPVALPAAGAGDPTAETFTDYVRVVTAGFEGDGCAPAATVAARVLAAVREHKLPLRRYAAVALPGGDYDPCGVITHPPAGWRVLRLGSVTGPYECTFYARGADNSEEYVSVRFEVERTDRVATHPPVELNGRAATRFCSGIAIPDAPERCSIDITLDGHYDGNVPDTPLGEPLRGAGTVRGTLSVYGNRAIVEQWAAAAAALYR